jgi:multiple sugar transport system substrate-binding protein
MIHDRGRSALGLVTARAFSSVLGLFLLLGGCSPQAGPPGNVLVFKHGKVPGDPAALRELLDRFEQDRGVRVVEETLPSASDVQHQYFITTLEGGSANLDVFSMDIVWVPEFVRAGWLLEVSDRLSPAIRSDLFPGPLEACTVGGRLYAVPWYVDGGVLYYRKDLLERYRRPVPRTFPELAETALAVLKGEGESSSLYGYLWQGKQYEGLVCTTLEALSSFGGAIRTNDGVQIDSPAARGTLRFLRSLVTTGASPSLVTTADEESTRLLFGAGRAVFLRSWVYAWNLFEAPGSPVKDRVGLAPIPPGPLGHGRSALGGWQLAIYHKTRNPDLSWALIEFLLRPESQAFLTRTVGYRPSRRSLYKDPGLLHDLPVLEALLPILAGGEPRPPTPLYPALSEILQSEFSAAVTGVKSVDQALDDAQGEATQLFRESGTSQ